MTNRLELALEQAGQVFLEMAHEIKDLKTEIEELQILVHKHESVNERMSNIYKGFYIDEGRTI